MVEWARKSYLGPTEIESFVNCFGQNPGARKEPSSHRAFMVYGSSIDQWNEEGRWVQGFPLSFERFESFSSDLS